MTYRVRLVKAAKRPLSEELPQGVAAAAWEFVLGSLAENPQRVGKPLRLKYEGLHSARRGDYRVLYRIHDDAVVEVLRVEHRRTVYRQLRQG